MLAITCDIRFDIRLFYHVITDKGRQGFHPQELVGLVEVQVDAVNADAVEELIGIGKSFQRGVPGQAQQVFFPCIRPPEPYFLPASERVRPSLAYRLPWPAVNTSSMYFFRIQGSPIHQPGI